MTAMVTAIAMVKDKVWRLGDPLPKEETQTKEGFCLSLDWNNASKIRWFDRTGMLQLNEALVARIELDSNGASGVYPGFSVTVINRREGEVARKYFLFDDYLDRSPDLRTDGRTDYPPRDGGQCFHVWHNWTWYIAVPKNTRPFCAAIEGWLEEFR